MTKADIDVYPVNIFGFLLPKLLRNEKYNTSFWNISSRTLKYRKKF